MSHAIAWIEIGFSGKREALAEIEAWLTAQSALSITYFDPDNKHIFEHTPGQAAELWEHCHIKGLFDNSTDTNINALFALAQQRFPTHKPYMQNIEDQVWEQTWMDSFTPLKFGQRTWVIPSHHEDSVQLGSNEIGILLDPGLAFGTGTHPTTSMCLAWLDAHVKPNDSVIDYGCGSGILAIAAHKLGAQPVYGFDIDPHSITASQENSHKNHCNAIVFALSENATSLTHTTKQEAQCNSPCADICADIVVANILANPLCALKNQLISLLKPNGHLILSGILATQENMVKNAYHNDIMWHDTQVTDDWVLLIGQKKTVAQSHPK